MVKYQTETILKGDALDHLGGDYDSYTRAVRKLARSFTYHGTFKVKLFGDKKTECLHEEFSSVYPYRHKCTGSIPDRVRELHTLYRFHSPVSAMLFLKELEAKVLGDSFGSLEGIEHIVKRADGRRLVELTDDDRIEMRRAF